MAVAGEGTLTYCVTPWQPFILFSPPQEVLQVCQVFLTLALGIKLRPSGLYNKPSPTEPSSDIFAGKALVWHE